MLLLHSPICLWALDISFLYTAWRNVFSLSQPKASAHHHADSHIFRAPEIRMQFLSVIVRGEKAIIILKLTDGMI